MLFQFLEDTFCGDSVGEKYLFPWPLEAHIVQLCRSFFS